MRQLLAELASRMANSEWRMGVRYSLIAIRYSRFAGGALL